MYFVHTVSLLFFMCLSSPLSSNNIILPLKRKHWSTRDISSKREYIFPEERGINPLSTNEEEFKNLAYALGVNYVEVIPSIIATAYGKMEKGGFHKEIHPFIFLLLKKENICSKIIVAFHNDMRFFIFCSNNCERVIL